MRQALSLRQIETFKAFVEAGSVSRAAVLLGISQPAVSKLLAGIERETRLELFDRSPGRVAVTARGIKLYQEIDRTFAGLGQIERAVEAIRREEQGQILVGVMPALSGAFIADVVQRFRAEAPAVYVSIVVRSSQFLSQWLVSKQLDVVLLNSPFDHAHVRTEPLLRHPLVCIAPKKHAFARKRTVRPADMTKTPFVAFSSGSQTRTSIDAALRECGVVLQPGVEATTSATLCNLVAAGLGVSLVHPLLAHAARDRITVRPFSVDIPSEFLLCRRADARNPGLVDGFLRATREAADQIRAEMTKCRTISRAAPSGPSRN